jgi:multiple sugar transport system ATP-binding protein
MDEPLSNLDAKLRVQTRAEISRLHQRLKATTIYVTHDQVEAMTMGDRIAVMSLGVLQQVGTPRQLYEAPVNRFVAGFIGSPAMNFMDLKVESGDAGQRLAGQGVTLDLDERLSALVRNAGLQTVTLGVRPEHLNVGRPEGPGLRMSAVVDVTEFLGNDELIHAAVEGQDLVAIVNAEHALKVGEKVELHAPPKHLHLFSPESELALSFG